MDLVSDIKYSLLNKHRRNSSCLKQMNIDGSEAEVNPADIHDSAFFRIKFARLMDHFEKQVEKLRKNF